MVAFTPYVASASLTSGRTDVETSPAAERKSMNPLPIEEVSSPPASPDIEGPRRVLELIGNTPLVDLSDLLDRAGRPQVRLYAKAEYANPGGSVKDRPALAIIEDAECRGLFTGGRRLLDSTSGNTGIAYAMIGAAKGIPV